MPKPLISDVQSVLDSFDQLLLFIGVSLTLVILGANPLQYKVARAFLLLSKLTIRLGLVLSAEDLVNDRIIILGVLEFLLQLIDRFDFASGTFRLVVSILRALRRLCQQLCLQMLTSVLVVAVSAVLLLWYIVSCQVSVIGHRTFLPLIPVLI